MVNTKGRGSGKPASGKLRKNPYAGHRLVGNGTLTKFVNRPLDGSQGNLPRLDDPAMYQHRTIFPKSVKSVGDVKNILTSGHSNSKIGRDVRKGPLKGYWIYCLSLEERATCPTECRHWRSCYGNNMPFAQRVDHSDFFALTRGIDAQLEVLTKKHKGVLVRLHVLGDFFSLRYIMFWRQMLRYYDNLAVFGYTAHHPKSELGTPIKTTIDMFGFERFAIRFSNAGLDDKCTVSIEHPISLPSNAFLCPEQTGRTACCATCGACWHTRKNVAFLQH